MSQTVRTGLAQNVEPTTDPCSLVDRWTIHPRLAEALVAMTIRLPFRFRVISGYRTAERQAELAREGRPAAPDHLSTHRSCPATGVDVWPDVEPVNTVKAMLGVAAMEQGLRWGGGSPVDPQTGIPSDWNHLDLGPRS